MRFAPNVVTSLSLLFLVAAPVSADCLCPAADVRVIGHRGAGTNGAGEALPENTIASAVQAFAEGADMVEIDVQTTADGAVVLMHDDTVERTTDGTGCVSALTLAEIRALDAGGGIRVPTLAELLASVEGGVNIEIKLQESGACPAQDPSALVDAVVLEVRAASAQDRVLVSSFALDVLERVRALEPSIAIGYLSANAGDIDVASAAGFEAIHLLAIAANARAVRRAHDAGLAVNVWTVNGESAVASALDVGVDAVITDTASEAALARAEWCGAYVCPAADAGASLDAGTRSGGPSGGCSAVGRRSALVLPLVALLIVVIRRRTRPRAL